jgi:hypothetical protein
MKHSFENQKTILKAGDHRVWKSKGWWPGISIVLEYHPLETVEGCDASLQSPDAFSSICYPSAVLEIVLKPLVSVSIKHDYEI